MWLLAWNACKPGYPEHTEVHLPLPRVLRSKACTTTLGATLDFKLRASREKKMLDRAFLIYLQGRIFQKILNCGFISHYSDISLTREIDAYGKKDDDSEPRANLSQPISRLWVHSFSLKLPSPNYASFSCHGHIGFWPLLGCWVLTLLCILWTCGSLLMFQ